MVKGFSGVEKSKAISSVLSPCFGSKLRRADAPNVTFEKSKTPIRNAGSAAAPSASSPCSSTVICGGLLNKSHGAVARAPLRNARLPSKVIELNWAEKDGLFSLEPTN